ncbi:unnamed protein product [Phaedon cochleariae]|uniref:receptor protein-tyrosine kinase n=1 Tax=Phaedon cochleariae TaxID=80249 RepID=A0A9P0DTG4_PHACE|nr:unnamed protein product [Phaedon cochleariae]
MEEGLIVFCLTFFCCGLLDISLGGASFNKPQILVNGSQEILEVNSNHSIFCQGNKPVQWKLPEITERYSVWTTFKMEETKPTSPYFQYGNRLYITNMTYPFVGFYYCQYKNAKEPEESSRIYIDVEEEETFEKPQILLVNGTEKVLEINGNDSFLCQGNRPVHWKHPKIEERYATWTTIKIEEVKPTNLHGRYGSRLYVTNMTFPFVGFYYCLYENVEDIERGSRIYLYVDDPENLSVTADIDDLDNGTVDIIYGRQYETVILPCRPTSPYVDVTLKEVGENGQVPQDVLLRDETVVHFNRFFGFITNKTAEISQKLYLCSFIRDSNTKTKGVQIISEKSKSSIATPFIKDNNNGHTTVGKNLSLTCSVYSEITIDFQWRGPHGPIDPQLFVNSDEKEYTSTLQIDKTELDDRGVYTCYVSDHQHHTSNSSIEIKIFGLEEHNLTMAEMNNKYYIETYAGKEDVKFTVFIWGHPHLHYTWSNNRNMTISNKKSGGKYDIEFKHNYLTLTINYINITDLGHYTLTGTNSYDKNTLDFFLNVTDKPSVTMETEPFHMLGKPGKVNCTASAHPAPIFQWGYKSCLRDDCILQQIESTIIEEWDVVFVSQVELNTSEPVGLLKCIAKNFIGSDESTIQYIVSDFENGFSMTGFDESVVFDESGRYASFAIGHPVKVKCGASKQKYKNIVWLLNGSPLKADDRFKITQSMTDYSYISYLEIEEVKYEDTGNYSCRVEEVKSSNGRSSFRKKTMRFFMEYPTKPKITGSDKKETIERNYPQEAELFCEVYGIPKPKIIWYKGGSEFDPDGSRILLKNGNQVLRFNQTSEQDEASYECSAQNEQGKVSKTWHLKIKNKGGSSLWYFVIIVVLFIICLVTVSCIVVKVRKEKRLQRELKLLGLANFEKGAVENINPELGLDDQAELLPYDKKWEFPIEQLKLGKQLGSGAFGVVMKGEAKHIVDGEPLTTVAVKMVKKNADHIYIKALASELKIMVHLGQHLNVVNLLGACTKNVVKKELLVIVEYCRYGNLQNYLLRHRDNFVHQVDPKNGKLNYSLGQDILDRTYSVSSNRSEIQSPLLKYAALAFSNKGNGPILPPSSSMGDYRAKQNSGGSDTTDMTAVSQSNEIVLSNNSIQPEWRSNYKGDYRGNVKPISTKDLVAWSFQVARGMDYLSSRKVLHGDLAARNILLSDDNIVKICDFGLAKTMYKNDNYKKRSDCPLPVKWMAIESIRDRIFSTQSDAWSFGIVLWELFSLARTPYPGMEADERLYHKLVDGYRMEAPEYAPKEIYDLMTDCWKSQPLERPSFSKLTERLGNLLEDTIKKYYIDLNDPYLAMNTKLIEDGKSDYLAMVSPPTFEALSSPHQLHDSSDDGYMSMNPGGIFSPRVTEGEIFDFNIPNRKPLSSEGGTGHELLPMLHVLSESDSETPLATPNQSPNPNGVSNPSYQLPPSITQEKTASSGEIVKSADNYVNMPQNKSMLRDKANVDEKKDKVVEHNYVNGDIRDWESVNAV